MQYEHILTLIDAEVERLRKARELLVISLAFRGGTEGTRSLPLASPTAFGIAASQVPLIAQQLTAQETRAISKKPPRRTQRQTPQDIGKPAVPAFEKPLGGVVSTRPVFVPAELIRETHAQQNQVQPGERSTLRPTSDQPLTVELLKERWLHKISS